MAKMPSPMSITAGAPRARTAAAVASIRMLAAAQTMSCPLPPQPLCSLTAMRWGEKNSPDHRGRTASRDWLRLRSTALAFFLVPVPPDAAAAGAQPVYAAASVCAR